MIYKVRGIILKNYLNDLIIINISPKRLNYIFIYCFIVQILLYMNSYMNFTNGNFYPLGNLPNQIGVWDNILFISWIILITFLPWGKRLFLLLVYIFIFMEQDIITLYISSPIPIQDVISKILSANYFYFIENIFEYPFIYIGRIFTNCIGLIFFTLFMFVLTIIIQVVLFLIKGYIIMFVNKIKK